jgi:hypothetical protein
MICFLIAALKINTGLAPILVLRKTSFHGNSMLSMLSILGLTEAASLVFTIPEALAKTESRIHILTRLEGHGYRVIYPTFSERMTMMTITGYPHVCIQMAQKETLTLPWRY